MREAEIQPATRKEIATNGTSAKPMLIVDGRWESTRTAAENLERQTAEFNRLRREDITPQNLQFLLRLRRNTSCWAGSIAEVCEERSGSEDEQNSLNLIWQTTTALSHDIGRMIDSYMERAREEASQGKSGLLQDFSRILANYIEIRDQHLF